MQVAVKFFGRAKELAGAAEWTVALPDGATTADLKTLITERAPALEAVLPATALSLNLEYVRSDCRLHDGDEVALIPPVSGGACGPAHA